MEVRLKPETESRLNELAAKTGRQPDELLEDAVSGYLEELSAVRNLLDSRYDDIKSGRVKPIDGEDALARLREKSEAARSKRS
jgi:predicted DNA-binding protein